MRRGFLSSLTSVLAGAGLALTQAPSALAQAQASQPGLVSSTDVSLAPAPDARPSQNKASDLKEPIAEPIAAPASASPGSAAEPRFDVQNPIMTGHVYGGVEYLLWSTKAERLPPLATTSTGPTAPGVSPGTLQPPPASPGPSNTVILYGDDAALSQERSGARLTAGYWLDSCQSVAVEASGFILSPRGSGFNASSTDGTILARPFLNPNVSANPLVAESSLVLGSPTQTGSLAIAMRNELWGAETNARWFVRGGDWYRVDFLAGLRYLQVKDSLSIVDDTTAAPGFFFPVPPRPTSLTATSMSNLDSFLTRNDFYGGQVGSHVELKQGPWFVDITGKLAMGLMSQHVDINGITAATNTSGSGGINPGTIAIPGGVFAQPGYNIGSHTRDVFGIVPELGFNAGYQIGSHVRAFVGYNVIYFRDDVLRAGTQVDRVVFPQGSIATAPVYAIKNQDFWAQGLTFGVEIGF